MINRNEAYKIATKAIDIEALSKTEIINRLEELVIKTANEGAFEMTTSGKFPFPYKDSKDVTVNQVRHYFENNGFDFTWYWKDCGKISITIKWN